MLLRLSLAEALVSIEKCQITILLFILLIFFKFMSIYLWRRLHNEELHSLYRLPVTVRVIKYKILRWANHVARMEEDRSDFKILTGIPTGKRPLGSPRGRWENNIKIDLQEIAINAVNWVDSTQDRDYWRALVNAELDLRVP